MDHEGINCSFHFRFLDLSKEQAESLNKLTVGASFGKHFKTKSITSSVELSESVILDLKKFISNNAIDPETTDIFISVVSEYDTRIVEIPNYINKAVIDLGSKIVFSFTYIH